MSSPTPVHTADSTSTPTPVAGPRLLQSIALGNILSFGPEMPRLPLGNLINRKDGNVIAEDFRSSAGLSRRAR